MGELTGGKVCQIHSRWQIRDMKAVDVCRKSSEVSNSDDIFTPDDITGCVHLVFTVPVRTSSSGSIPPPI